MIHHGDCLSVLRGMADDSLDACVTDPPYGLSFMGKGWDYDVPSVEIWREVFRVLKPGAHLLAFAGTRTQHRMAVNIEDAGFEVRDMIAWVYGSGFPKSYDVAQSIEKRETIGHARRPDRDLGLTRDRFSGSTEGKLISDTGGKVPLTTDAARQWQGWGTALKPALEPITVARKPLIGTVAVNVQTHGTGALNIDGCRIGNDERTFLSKEIKPGSHNIVGSGWDGDNGKKSVQGRWPANLIHDGSEEVLAGFPETGPSKASNRGLQHSGRHGGLADIGANIKPGTDTVRGHSDAGGSAARFFYCAKASKSDRDEGLDHLEKTPGVFFQTGNGTSGKPSSIGSITAPRANHHPTVKPTDLMRYLCRLVTPPGGTVLDPFMGSGSTGKAAILEGFQFVGIEREAEYLEIARARIEHVKAKPRQEALL